MFYCFYMFLFVLSCFSKWRKQHLVAGAVIFSQFVSDKSDKSVSLFFIEFMLIISKVYVFWTQNSRKKRKFSLFSSFSCSILIFASPRLCVLKTKFSTHCHNFLENTSTARGISCEFMLKYPFFSRKTEDFLKLSHKTGQFSLTFASETNKQINFGGQKYEKFHY